MKTTPEIQQAIDDLPTNDLPIDLVIALMNNSQDAYDEAIDPKSDKQKAAFDCKNVGYTWLFAIVANFRVTQDTNRFLLLLKERVEFFLKIAEGTFYKDIRNTKDTITIDVALNYLDLQYKLLSIYAFTSNQKEFSDALRRISTQVIPIFNAKFGKEQTSKLFSQIINNQQWQIEEASAAYLNIYEFNSIDLIFNKITALDSESERLHSLCLKPYTTKSVFEAYEKVLKKLSATIADYERIVNDNSLQNLPHQISDFKTRLKVKINELPGIKVEVESWMDLHNTQYSYKLDKMRRAISTPEVPSQIKPVHPPGDKNLRNRKKPRGKSFNL